MSGVISVIIPVYKAEEYLERCVDSVLAQTYSNLEIILVDDGSPDDSGLICDRYAEKDSRVIVIHKKNGGVSSARNAGLDVATGEFVAFVDSDDFIAPDMYEKLMVSLSSGSDLSMCDFMMYSQSYSEPRTTIPSGDRISLIKSLLLADIGSGSVYLLIKSFLLERLRFPEHIRNGEDLWFVLRLFSSVNYASKVDEPLYYYNQDNCGSLTHTLDSSTDLDGINVFKENMTFLHESGIFESVKKEWYWSLLRYKSTFVMTPKRFDLYRTVFPEANEYVSDCPLLSSKMKMVMHLLDKHLDIFALPIVWAYRLMK